MRIPKFFLSFAVVSILKSNKVHESVLENAKKIDALIDHEFGKKSEEVQAEAVENILIPLASELMKENKTYYKSMLWAEIHRLEKEKQ